jgi:hypothetical protein
MKHEMGIPSAENRTKNTFAEMARKMLYYGIMHYTAGL